MNTNMTQNTEASMGALPDLKGIIAKNIATLRVSAKLTQLELAEKLNYSDKSVSKWERGDSIPDVIVLKQIADLFSVTLDYLVTEHEEEKTPLPPENIARKRRNRLLVEWLSIIGVVTLSTIVFALCCLWGSASWAWLSFIAALPVSSIVSLVFRSIWGKKIDVAVISSALFWLLAVFIHLLTLVAASINIWHVYIVCIPAQIIIILAFCITFKK